MLTLESRCMPVLGWGVLFYFKNWRCYFDKFQLSTELPWKSKVPLQRNGMAAIPKRFEIDFNTFKRWCQPLNDNLNCSLGCCNLTQTTLCQSRSFLSNTDISMQMLVTLNRLLITFQQLYPFYTSLIKISSYEWPKYEHIWIS